MAHVLHLRYTWRGIAIAACLAALVGCGGGGEESPAEPGTPEASGTPAPGGEAGAAAPAIPEGATGVMGKVTFEGPRPERTALETEADATCFEMHMDEPLLSDDKVVSEDGGVRWSFVYVKNPPDLDYEAPDERAVLDQVGCRYTPHVLGVQLGQELEIANSDDTLHNVRGITHRNTLTGQYPNEPFNLGQPAGTPPRIREFDEPEMAIRMKCDVHPWMTAYVFVMDHPFFAVTDEQGAYAITGLPAGEYTVVAWHEVWGEAESTITVEEGAMAEATFTFTASE